MSYRSFTMVGTSKGERCPITFSGTAPLTKGDGGAIYRDHGR